MQSPRHLGAYPARPADCAKALEDALVDTVDAAASAGWDRTEIWSALARMATAITAADKGLDDVGGDPDQATDPGDAQPADRTP